MAECEDALEQGLVSGVEESIDVVYLANTTKAPEIIRFEYVNALVKLFPFCRLPLQYSVGMDMGGR